MEGLRQICIFNISVMETGGIKQWISYIKEYRICLQRKINDPSENKNACFIQVYDKLGSDALFVKSIDACIKTSFEDTSDVANSRNYLLES